MVLCDSEQTWGQLEKYATSAQQPADGTFLTSLQHAVQPPAKTRDNVKWNITRWDRAWRMCSEPRTTFTDALSMFASMLSANQSGNYKLHTRHLTQINYVYPPVHQFSYECRLFASQKCITFTIITHAGCIATGMEQSIQLHLSVCPCSKRKTTWAISTKVGRHSPWQDLSMHWPWSQKVKS